MNSIHNHFLHHLILVRNFLCAIAARSRAELICWPVKSNTPLVLSPTLMALASKMGPRPPNTREAVS